MFYLLIAILSSAALVILLKVFDMKGVNIHVGITVNYVLAGALSLMTAESVPSIGHILASDWIWAAIILGVMFSVSFLVFGLSAQLSGVAVTAISARAAVVIPVAFAFAFLGGEVTAVKIAMLALIVAAMAMIVYKPKEVPGRASRHGWLLLLPLGVFLFNGANDTIVQYSQSELVPQQEYMAFLGVMFGFAAITAFITFTISTVRKPHRPNGKDLLWGSLLGFMNWVCMTGVFYGLVRIDGTIFFPLYYSGVIIVATLTGVLAFKEKLSKLNIAGIIIALIGIAVLSTQ